MKFQWNYYVGEHMVDALKINAMGEWEDDEEKTHITFELNGVCYKSYSINVDVLSGEYKGFEQDINIIDAIPIIKPLDTLTDEDILFIFECKGLDVKIKRGANSIRIFCRNGFSSDYSMEIYQINFFTKTSKNINQKILDNLYSLHRSPDEKALEEKGLVIVDREGVYYG